MPTIGIAGYAREHVPASRSRETYRLANVRLAVESSAHRRVDLDVRHHSSEGEPLTAIRVRDASDPGGSRETVERLSRFGMLAKLAPVGIVQLAADWSCLYVNDMWSALGGLSAEESSQSGWIDAIHPDDRTGYRSRIGGSIRTG